MLDSPSRHKRAFAFALCLNCLGSLSVAVALDQPTAICYFTTDAVSYLASQRVQKVAELVQAELMATNQTVQWVDRTQIETALNEIELQAFGKVDASGAMRLGHWLKADVLINVHCAHRLPLTWSIRWEIIDLDGADVLTSGSLEPPELHAGDDLAGESCVNVLHESLARGLTTALRERQDRTHRVLIAPLHFRNADSQGRIDYLEQDLRDHIEKRNTAQSKLRYLQFPRADDALEEANLIASGLVSTDQTKWRRIADYYVWGTYREIDSSGVPFPDVEIELSLELWNGRDDTLRLTRRGQVKDLDSLLTRAVAELEQHTVAKQTGEVSVEIRRQIAERLRVEVSDLQEWVIQVDLGDFSRPADEWLRRWRQCIRLLAIGAFLDPANENIRRELLVETTRRDLRFKTLPGNREFWRVWQCSDAWKTYCRQFGYDYWHVASPKLKHRPGLADNRMTIGAMHMFLKTSQDLLVAVSGNTSLHGNPVPPDDVPGEVLRQWQDEITREHIARIKLALAHPAARDRPSGWLLDSCQYYIRNPKLRAEALETLWPALVKSERPGFSFNQKILRDTFAAVDRPEIAEAMISAAGGTQPAVSAPMSVSPSIASRPRTATPAPQPLAPVVAVRIKPLSLRRQFYVRQVRALAHTGDRLWISVEGHSRTLAQGYALFTVDDDNGEIREFSGLSTAGSLVTDMLPEPGGLWLTLDGDGICLVDLQSGEIVRYGQREGLPSAKLFAIARQAETIYAGGGEEQKGVFASLAPPRSSWTQHKLSQNQLRDRTLPSCSAVRIACSDQWQAVYCHQGMSLTQILLRKTSGDTWKDVGERLRQEHPEFTHFDSSWRVKVAGLVWSHELLWIATSRGLVAYDPQKDSFPFVHANPWEFVAIKLDGDKLWLSAVPFTGRQGHNADDKNSILAGFNLKSRTWEAQIALPFKGTPEAMTLSESRLWVGMGDGVDVLSLDVSNIGTQ